MIVWIVIWIVLMMFWLFTGFYTGTNDYVVRGRSLIPWACVLILGLIVFGAIGNGPTVIR